MVFWTFENSDYANFAPVAVTLGSDITATATGPF
jgi:hypothetical protein